MSDLHISSTCGIIDDMITPQELAALAGVSRRRIYQLIAAGRLVGIKRSGVWLIDRECADKWMNSPREAGRPPKEKQVD